MKQLIQSYLEAYNAKNVTAMLAMLDDHVVFENISNTAGTISIVGKQAFEQLAMQTLPFFSERRQLIRFAVMEAESAAIEISYRAIVAQDLPNGLKAGEELQLRGVSVFEMRHGKFTRISDYS